ncbi:nuclear pore complex protein DDB_G0274915-like isoform X1 [Hylaeus volcanicus]|uniref:nuclear pore complex protein DDB_G0274915-like isoform X1 n=2 Tax=Hylaeus volcanicus TaxID=313075 RepID=UPI0023B8551C|nr:nuclear pore complex protein DDB_G0274915-like isoform X1 [Hylaeus volcanicus]
MWDLGNRGVVALVSVLSGCVFLYNVWGPILLLTISLFLTIYACYSLITSDSLFSPHAFLLFDYCKRISLEVRANFESIVDHICRYTRTLWESGNLRFRELYLTQTRMERRRGTHYQLSSDPFPTRRNSSKFGSISRLSPIIKTTQNSDAENIGSENKVYHNSDYSSYDRSVFDKHSSTPTFPRNKDEFGNKANESLSLDQTPSKRMSSAYSPNHSLSQGENVMRFTSEGSPWGTSIGPKVHPKSSPIETVRPASGPLTMSTRYNIDPRVYNDVTSPGLTTRLTKYAAEANNKLTHQSRYGVGQFPKVNLQASSIPLINAKVVKTKTPMIVRVVPLDAVRYSPPGKQKLLSDLCGTDGSCSSLSVVQTLRDISLKRHASREDVTFDLAKKQRTGGIVINEYETQDETKQKRSREDSSKSEEDTSPQSTTIRPTKRTKTPSCYDVLNSFSSSKHVASGVKRKAGDLSRSGTPDFEKHFKSLECVQNTNMPTLPETQHVKYRNHDIIENKNSDACNLRDKVPEHSPLKGILKTSTKSLETNSHGKDVDAKHTNVYKEKNQSTESMESAKLTNKLFMRAEPERNEKLRMLVEEQGNIRAKFTTDDVEEIKMEDIADMRQTSMKARLQSMFDAISGKASSKINPDVVIQAEEVNAVKSVACPVTCATLNSSTTTTNVNTTPISTSAVALSPGTSESHSKSPKHVSFSLPTTTKQTSSNLTVPVTIDSETKAENSSVSKSTVANFGFDKSAVAIGTEASSTSSGTFTFGAVAPNSNNQLSTSATGLLATSTTTIPASLFGNVGDTMSKPLAIPTTHGVLDKNNELNRNNTISHDDAVKMTSNVTPGSITFVSTPPNAPTSIAPADVRSKEQSTETTTSAMSFKSITSTVSSGLSAVTTTATPTTSASLFTFGNIGSNAPTSKPETFLFGNSTTPANCVSTKNNTESNIVTTNALNSNAKATIPTTFGSPSAFTFGATTSSASNNKPVFSFGSTVSTATNLSTGTSGTSTFVTGNNNNNISTSTFDSSSVNNTRQFNSNSSSIFGNASTTSIASIFGTKNSQPVFNIASNLSAIGAPKTTTTTIFGSTGGVTSSELTSANSTSAFSNTTSGSSSGLISTASVPIFASTVNTSASEVTGTSGNNDNNTNNNNNNLFSNVNSTSAFNATGNIFGQTKSPATNFKSTSGVFGSNAAPLFGSQVTTAATFGGVNVSNNTTAPVFGSTSVSSNATVPTFDTQTTVSSGFRTRSNAMSQNSPSRTFGARTVVFGTDNTSSTSVFGASSSGAFNSPTSNTFSEQNTTNVTFTGVKASPFSVQPSAFGAPNSNAPAFGTSNANTTNNNNTGIFTFGANQNPPQQNITTFSFASNNSGSGGSNNNNNNANNKPVTSASAPFQFTGATSKPVTGFNFSAPSTTPSINFGTTNAPTFNASTPGMFSIGSGSIAPRSRSVRTRKPR